MTANLTWLKGTHQDRIKVLVNICFYLNPEWRCCFSHHLAHRKRNRQTKTYETSVFTGGMQPGCIDWMMTVYTVWWLQQINPVAVSTTDSDVISGRSDRREDALVPPVDDATTANHHKSVEVKPEMTKRSAPNNRKRKEKRKPTDVKSMKEIKLEDKSSKSESRHAILNVPQYAQATCDEPPASDVTDLEESLPTTETHRWISVFFLRQYIYSYVRF